MNMIRFFLITLFVAIATLTFASPTRAAIHATFTVNTTQDTLDKKPGDGVCADKKGKCSLRAAIQETNALGGKNTVNVPAGTYILTRFGRNEDDSKTGDLDIRSNLTLKGAGASKSILDGNQSDAVIHVIEGKVTLKAITIKNGKAVSNLPNFVARGGGLTIGDLDHAPRVKLVNSIVSNNSTDQGGGGIFNFGTLAINTSRIENNSAESGGGIANLGALTVSESMLLYNNATLGGGVWSNKPSKFIRSTLGFNHATKWGGGIFTTFDAGNNLVLVNSSVSSNSANLLGGGIYHNGATSSLYNTTLHQNTVNNGGSGAGIYVQTGTFNLQNTLFSFNMVDSTATISDCAGTVNSNDYNMLSNTAGCTINGTTTNNVYSPIGNVGVLADNGGPTWTNSIAVGSYAIDAGNNAGCKDNLGNTLAVDQRGSPRPTDGDGTNGARCDIGAFEK